MSIKVYEAYQTVAGVDPVDLMISLKRQSRDTARRLLKKHYNAILDDPKRVEAVRVGRKKGEGAPITAFDVDDWVRLQYREQALRYERDPYSLDVSITLRKHKKRYYLIPYVEKMSPLGPCLDFLRTDPRLEDFCYWNNTDEPEGVTASKWKARAAVWNVLTEHEIWADFITIEIVSFFGWSEVSPALELAQARQRKEAG